MSIKGDIADKIRAKLPTLYGTLADERYNQSGVFDDVALNAIDAIAVEIATELNAEKGYTAIQIGRELLNYFLAERVRLYNKKVQDQTFDSAIKNINRDLRF